MSNPDIYFFQTPGAFGWRDEDQALLRARYGSAFAIAKGTPNLIEQSRKQLIDKVCRVVDLAVTAEKKLEANEALQSSLGQGWYGITNQENLLFVNFSDRGSNSASSDFSSGIRFRLARIWTEINRKQILVSVFGSDVELFTSKRQVEASQGLNDSLHWAVYSENDTVSTSGLALLILGSKKTGFVIVDQDKLPSEDVNDCRTTVTISPSGREPSSLSDGVPIISEVSRRVDLGHLLLN